MKAEITKKKRSCSDEEEEEKIEAKSYLSAIALLNGQASSSAHCKPDTSMNLRTPVVNFEREIKTLNEQMGID